MSKIDPMKLVEASISEAKGHAVREYLKDQDAEALRRRDEFMQAMKEKAAKLVKEPRR